MNKKISSIILAIIICIGVITPASASNLAKTSLLDGSIEKAAYIPFVNKNGSNLLNETLDQGKYTVDSLVLTTAEYSTDGQIIAIGSYNGKDFNVTARYTGKNENGNIDVFNGEDERGLYDVVYCAIEREISKSMLYFNSMDSQYTTALKLYLRDKETNAFLIVEVFDLPTINIMETNSVSASDSDVNAALCWVERTFEPVNTAETEVAVPFAASDNITKTIQYDYSALGLVVKNFVDFKMFWDFRDVSRGGSTTANAGIELLRRYRTCEDAPNNDSSTYSCLYLRDIEYELYTAKNMAVMTEQCETSVTKGGSIVVTNPSVSFSLSVKGLSVSVGKGITFSPGGSHIAGTSTKIHDNTDGEYARAVKTALDTKCSLQNAGNYFNISYTIGEYSGKSGLSNPTLYWNYYVWNELDSYESYVSSYRKDMTQIIT